jgi:hypothetical protein
MATAPGREEWDGIVTAMSLRRSICLNGGIEANRIVLFRRGE